MDTASQAMSKPHALNNMLKTITICLFAASFLAGCAKEKYVAKPINPQQTTAKILAKDPLSTDFKAYLIKQGYKQTEIPFASWGINELTASALFHHTKLDIAKAQLGLANAQLETASQKQNPTLNGSLARSNQKNDDIRPWAYGLNVEIPIETTGKRAIRIEEAQHLAEVARIDVADAAWQLRSQLAQDLTRHHENTARQKLLQQEVEIQSAIVKMLEKRVALGALSNTELSAAKLIAQKTQFSLEAEQAASQEIRANLAANAGLSLEKLSQIAVKPLEIEPTLAKQAENLRPEAFKSLQEKALLNRLDIRRGLEKYAAAEAKIKLEVAKQTPDISISPGFIFEFGDSIWSLGFSSLLNLLNTNQLNTSQTLIAEATQLRQVEGAQFEALQAKVIGDLSMAHARYVAAQLNLAAAKSQQAMQQVYKQMINKQFAAGALDRLELAQASLLVKLADSQVLTAQFDALRAANEMEDLLQMPLENNLNIMKP
jgi:outer membrane protein, heavy metal efflux system